MDLLRVLFTQTLLIPTANPGLRYCTCLAARTSFFFFTLLHVDKHNARMIHDIVARIQLALVDSLGDEFS
jgi:hypothetical protein